MTTLNKICKTIKVGFITTALIIFAAVIGVPLRLLIFTCNTISNVFSYFGNTLSEVKMRLYRITANLADKIL